MYSRLCGAVSEYDERNVPTGELLTGLCSVTQGFSLFVTSLVQPSLLTTAIALRRQYCRHVVRR